MIHMAKSGNAPRHISILAKGYYGMQIQLTRYEQLIHWPDLSDPRWNSGLAERARELHENTIISL